ncbi:MAG: ABC transporter permease, partial [Cyclobacteriaceae bacterium]|nr:ABC transporter permease [Cyclobacteriaceae bacterium]
MLWNYIKVGLRNLFRYKVFSFINIFGLAISMSVCLLIISMIAGLSKYDRFHENYDRIYRVLSKRENSGNFNATTPMPIREALIEDYSGIEKIVTFKRGFGGDASYENTSVPLVGYFCSEELFDVFSFKLEKGNPSSALKDPFSVVLTQESAKKVFGDKDPLGKVIRFSERGLVMAGIPNKNKPTFLGDFTVTGVLDEIPGKTHLEFHILASMSTLPTLETQGIDKTLQA